LDLKDVKSTSKIILNKLLVFLHYFDGVGLVLTSQSLNHKNYTKWSRAMHVAISLKKKMFACRWKSFATSISAKIIYFDLKKKKPLMAFFKLSS